ncbi:hypothetical protein [Streptacidiphilus jiangxiensis]|uniref:hypothetical protein n=1 Tax=Streptacidiphilus jiangxiensis TaxID=235985 RepID=UPI0005A8FA81|nr:hypothetical protein [Streptacidiphilus jiangxiensis]
MKESDGGRPDGTTQPTEPTDEGGQAEEGGEPACWLHRLCPECDAVQDAERPAHCWRCGAALAGRA